MKQNNMNHVDIKLLKELASDSSQPIKDLSRKVGVTRQTAASRISRLQKSSVITGFRAKIDYTKLGYSIFFLLFLKLGSFDEALLSKALSEFRSSAHVMLDASVTGEWDIVQMLAFKDTSEYDRYITNLRTKYGKVFRDSKSHAILRFFKTADEFVPIV